MSCVCRCVRNSCHALYATLRNGLWDDPAEAVTGVVYQDFLKVTNTQGLPEAAAIYLTWRYCYLKCFVLIGLVWAVASWSSWTPNRAAFDGFGQNLPQEIQPSRYETFIVVMSWWDPCLMYIWLSSFVLVLISIFLTSPSRVFGDRNRHFSRYLVWMAWLWNFVLPFLVLLAFPIRHTIDKQGLKEDLCVVAVSRSMSSPGIDLTSAVKSLDQQKLLSDISTLLGQDLKVTESSARPWCQEHPDDWHLIFCQKVLGCVLTVDQRCREEVCPSAPAEELQQCQQTCLDYAQRSGSGQLFLSSLSECDLSGSSLQLQAPVVSIPPAVSCNGTEATCGVFQQQERNIKDQCTYASMAVDKVDYVAGIFVGMEAGILLLPSALSIAGGLAESIYNIKALFPGHREFTFLLLLTSFQAVPIYTAMMAVTQQMIGDSTLLVTCAAFIAWVGLPGLTGFLTRHLHSNGAEHRWQFYRKVWLEYGMRAALGVAMLVSFSQYMREMVDERPDNAFSLMILMLLNYYTRKTLMAVASTDAALSAFLQCELWRASFAETDRAANQERISSLAPILGANCKPSPSTAGPPGAETVEKPLPVDEAKPEGADGDATLGERRETDEVVVPVIHPHHISEKVQGNTK